MSKGDASIGRLAGKVAIVTGAASSSGLGRAIADLFAAEGALVALTDIDEPAGRQAARKIGGDATFLHHDVRDDASWQGVMADVQRRFGVVDILINNAGITGAAGTEDIENFTLDTWRQIHAVNVEGVMLGCKWAVRSMKQRGGAIVNIASMAGMMGTPSLPAYGASKAAVRQITQTVALHCARRRYGVRCNSIHPGVIDTEGLHAALTDEALGRLRDSVPSGELGAPADVANAALFLSCDDSRYVTGARLMVDGGVTMN